MEGEIAQNLQQPANAEALEQATSLLQDLRAQNSTSLDPAAHVTGSDAFQDDAEAETWGTEAAEGPVDSDAVLGRQTATTPQTKESGATHSQSETVAVDVALPGKPLVEPPEFGDRVRDTDKEPFWIPGAFPTIFQNETGDLHTYVHKEPDMLTWGPHIMRSRGWHAQAHMTFSYWWLNMVQRTQVLSAKKWYVRDNPKATGYTVDDIRGMSVRTLAKNMVGYTANIPGTRAS